MDAKALLEAAKAAIPARSASDGPPDTTITLLTTQQGLQVYGWPHAKTEIEYVMSEMYPINQYLRHGIHIPRGGVVVDVGAHIGLFGVAALAAQPDITYMAIEPSPATFTALVSKMVGKNNVYSKSFFGLNSKEYGHVMDPPQPGRMSPPYPHNLHVVAAALSDTSKPDEAFTFYPHMPGNSTLRPQEKEMMQKDMMPSFFEDCQQVRVPVFTLHELMQLRPQLHHIHLLKVDVEGEELAVLRSLDDEDWSKVDQVVLEIHDCIDSGPGQSTFDFEGERGGPDLDGSSISFISDAASVLPQAEKFAAAFGGLRPPHAAGRVMAVARLLRDKGFKVVVECTMGVPLNYNAYAVRPAAAC